MTALPILSLLNLVFLLGTCFKTNIDLDLVYPGFTLLEHHQKRNFYVFLWSFVDPLKKDRDFGSYFFSELQTYGSQSIL